MKLFITLCLLFLAACSVEHKASAIQGKVSIPPNLSNKIGPSDVLYVLAYPESQSVSENPLAVQKIAPVILPAKYSLSQKDVLFPEKKFAGPLQIIARLHSNPESAPAQKGQMEGVAKKNPAKPGDKNVDILLQNP